jgi:hypothetical protein
MNMQQDLLAVRSQLVAATARIDRLLAGTAPAPGLNPLKWRTRPGGPLSEAGTAEIRRRLAEGETDVVIARDMGITVQGAHKARKRELREVEKEPGRQQTAAE